MKATNYLIEDVPDAVEMLNGIHVIGSETKIGMIGEIGFLLGNPDLEGGEMSFYIKIFGECVQIPNKDEEYIAIIILKKLVFSITATVIYY